MDEESNDEVDDELREAREFITEGSDDETVFWLEQEDDDMPF